jgi:peptidoglycan/LPS O-acetylase OafA/YrhL
MSVQYLRAIMAIMVVLFHFEVQLERFGYSGSWLDIFDIRVDIFFVLSGFLVWLATFDTKVSLRSFIYRRIIRIIPLYWIVTTFFVIIMLIFPSAVKTGQFNLYHVLASYFFIPWVHPIMNEIRPVVVAGWTLNYLAFFCIIFSLFLSYSAVTRAIGVIFVLVTISVSGLVLNFQVGIFDFYSSGIVLEFLFGVALGILYCAGFHIPQKYLWMLLVAACAVMFFRPAYVSLPRWISYGIPAMFCVGFAVYYERGHRVKRWATLILLGDISYALYLSHGAVLSAVTQIFMYLGLINVWGGIIIFSIISFFLVFLVAVGLHFLIEKPLATIFAKRILTHQPHHNVDCNAVGETSR